MTRNDTGDGDTCPLDPAHGKMYVVNGQQSQWCAHQTHDGRPKSSLDGKAPRTRNVWPLGDKALAEAVEKEHSNA